MIDKIIAVVILIAVVVILLSGELYFRMDKSRSRALVCLKKMDPGIQKWLRLSNVVLTSENVSSDLSREYAELNAALAAVPPKRPQEIVPILNRIYLLNCSAVADNIDDPLLTRTVYELTSTYNSISQLREEYNTYVADLNDKLEGRFFGRIGKLARFSHFEKLRDLSIL